VATLPGFRCKLQTDSGASFPGIGGKFGPDYASIIGNEIISVLILSDKSSGSSMLQRQLGQHNLVNRIEASSNNYESKFWVYAISALNMEQVEMKYSHEFPIHKRKAITKLNQLLDKHNIDIHYDENVQVEDIYRGWDRLCKHYLPVFLEKSPHHLHNQEALKLIHNFSKGHSNINVKYIGLIRNPMDTLYSMWTRWHVIPEQRQFEWL